MSPWFIILICVIAVAALVGYFVTGRNKEGAVAGGCLAGVGCGYILVRILILALGILILLWLANWLFDLGLNL